MSQIQYIDRRSGEIITETPPAEGLIKFFYSNPVGKLGLEALIKRKVVSSLYGGMMDKPSSTKKIQKFVDDLGIDMSESVKSIDEFTSFNDFFYRHLKNGARPIGEGLVSPGDGRLLAFENVNEVNSFYVKGREFTVKEYLGDNELAEKYKDAPMIILRLAPNDYHRYHFPYDGVPTAIKNIKGHYYSVSPLALAVNFTKVFCENKRAYNILKTEKKGEILLSPVAATMVGSMTHNYTSGKQITKGHEMGYFSFGGSTVVMFLEKDKFKIDQDLIENTKKKIETYVKMGEQIGV